MNKLSWYKNKPGNSNWYKICKDIKWIDMGIVTLRKDRPMVLPFKLIKTIGSIIDLR